MIPDEVIERIASALIQKWRGMRGVAGTPVNLQEHIDSAVRTTVCDTCLILEGSVPIEAYESGREMGRA